MYNVPSHCRQPRHINYKNMTLNTFGEINQHGSLLNNNMSFIYTPIKNPKYKMNLKIELISEENQPC